MLHIELKYNIETNKSIDDIYNIFETNKILIDQELKQNFFIKLAGFHLTLNKQHNNLKIESYNPFRNYTTLKILPSNGKNKLVIQSVPHNIYGFIFLVLSWVLFTLVAISWSEYIFTFGFCSLFVLIGTVNQITKYGCFNILVNFCKSNFEV